MTDDVLAAAGRHDANHDEIVTIHLLNFPLALFAQTREHHDDLFREFALLALQPPEQRPSDTVPVRLTELIEILGRRYGGDDSPTDAVRDAAVARGELAIDLVYRAPRSVGAMMAQLHALLTEADGFCRDEKLLTLAATPLELAFRSWMLNEFIDQAAGGYPVPWSLPTGS